MSPPAIPPAIEAVDLCKRYPLRARKGDRAYLSRAMLHGLRERLASWTGREPQPDAERGEVGGQRERGWVWALRDVNLTVHGGETVGLIGHNGAGKSTLLKIVSRLTLPTSGHVVVRGRVGSMLGIGAGFRAELTGRENVYLCGMVMGLSRRDVRHHFRDIVDFSGVEDYLDVAVKRYSAGMRARLAFAVTTTLEPEVLLLDEVLGVGDQTFQERSRRRIETLAAGGRAVVLVSHSYKEVHRLCDRVIKLDAGRIIDVTDAALVPPEEVRQKRPARAAPDEPSEHDIDDA